MAYLRSDHAYGAPESRVCLKTDQSLAHKHHSRCLQSLDSRGGLAGVGIGAFGGRVVPKRDHKPPIFTYIKKGLQ